MTPEELSERLWEFAARIAKVVDALPDTRMGRHIASQLCRCGTSSAPNYDETIAAESRADFIHKMKIAAKEADETEYWLLLCKHSKSYPDPGELLIAIQSILKVLSKIISSIKGKG